MKSKILILILLMLCGCASNESGTYQKSSDVANELNKRPPTPWKEMNSEGSDYALINDKTKTIFLFNSACRKYEGGNLNSLTNSMLAGIEELNVVEKKNSFYQGRDAIELLASGKVDGIERFFKVITMQKNNCIYDYIMIATTRSNVDADASAMQTFLQRIIIK